MLPQPRRPLFLLIVMLVVVVSGCVNTGSGQPATVALDGTGRILIRNASLVLTMDPKLGEGPLGRLQDVDVLIDGDRIGVVGKHLPAGGAMVLNGHGKIV